MSVSTCECPLLTETVLCAHSDVRCDAMQFLSWNTGFHLTIDLAAQFPRFESSGVWCVGSAMVTPLLTNNVDHMKQLLVKEWRHFMTSSTEQCNSGMLVPVKWWPFWAKTINW